MEAKQLHAPPTFLTRWLFILAIVVQAIAQEDISQEPTNYKECYLGKGLAKLYNCDRKYDRDGSGIIQLNSFTTPARYIIKLKVNETSETVDAICSRAASRKPDMYSGTCIYKYDISFFHDGSAEKRYKTVLVGMLMLMNGGNLSLLITKEAAYIDYVEVDGSLRVCGSIVQGHPPSWGLDRIDHLPGQTLLNGLFASTASGTDVHVYVFDTGIRCSHIEFRYQDERVNKTSGIPQVRCVDGFDGVNDGFGTNDCNGHGTHVAGIVGGLRTGVGKDVFLHPVRILGCDGSGTYGAMIAALEWVVVNLVRPAVLLLPISTQASTSIDQAINNAVNISGVIGIAAAGNFMQEACNYSPARAASVITVGSTNSLNEMSWFSNYGPCTTMFAPGEVVYSAYFRSDTAYATLSGTSMACPFVAGAAALYLSQNSLATPADVRQSLMDATEWNAVSTTNLKPGTTTRLLNTNRKPQFYRITPRSFYGATENTTYAVVVSLLMKPATTVFLTPSIDATIGYFIPKLLLFPSDVGWSYPQTINLVLFPCSDYLDHFAKIQWVFTSRDTRFVASPESWVTAKDTDVCKKTATSSCGQTFDSPKTIPSLPFHYVDDTSQYQDVYNEDTDSFDASCHSRGPDLLFQYIPSQNMLVNISLCGATTQFDTLLSVYDYKKLDENNLTLIACNDDYCDSQSMLINIPLLAGHVYIIMIDGYRGGGGPVEIYVYGPGASPVPRVGSLPSSIPVMISSFSASNRSAKVMCTQWEGADCQPAPTPLPIQAEFFWSPVRWDPCDKHCGGGLQQAVMECFTGNYSMVDDWNCAQVPVPTMYQVCNLVACSNYTVFEGPWDACSRSCGGGVQTRQVICMDNMGNTAHPDRCGGETEFDKLQSCNVQPCNATRWEAGSWNYCNVPCAGGKRFRDAVCISDGTVVDDEMCDPLVKPSKELHCNTQPCQTYAWLVGRWEECPHWCTATKARSVLCVDGGGQTVADAFCNPSTKPSTITACQQPSLVCGFCAYNNCSGNGVCKNGVCSCADKWMGDYCEKPKVCNGKPMGLLKDGSVDCCPHSTVDVNQRCCLGPEAIDVNGACCHGSLDACGICNGPHISVDSQNQCCPTIRDEKGVCCLSGRLDECYICDGDGTTCATNVSMLAILDDSLDVTRDSSVDWKAFMLKFMMKVASKLNVAAEGVILTGVRTMNTLIGDCTTIAEIQLGCLGTGTRQLLAVFNFSVLPIPLRNLTFMTVEEADTARNLFSLDDNSNGEFVTGLKIKEVLHVSRAGLCGNGMCERGERCNQNGRSSTTDGPCCLADCPYVPVGCPITLHGPRKNLPCSKNGICFDASGQCDCFDGYNGEACDMCINGYNKLPDGQCIKVPDASVITNLSKIFVSIKQSNGNVHNAGGSPVGTIIILIICSGVVYMCWRTYGQNITSSPAAQGALQALGLATGSHSEDARNPSETGGGTLQRGPPSTETSSDDPNKRARRSSLKEERREAVEERRKSRSYGPEHSSMRKSLMMTRDSAGVGEAQTHRVSGLSPIPTTQQRQGGVMGDSGAGRRTSLEDQQSYSELDSAVYKDEEPNYRNYPNDMESNYRNNARNDESNFRAVARDEEQGYNSYPSSSATFLGGGPSTPSSTNFFASGPNTSSAANFFRGGTIPFPTNLFGGSSNAPSSANIFGSGSNAPSSNNFFGGGRNSPSDPDIL